MINKPWPLRYRLAYRLHYIVNRLAWWIHNPERKLNGSLPWIWKLNDFMALLWINWWINQQSQQQLFDAVVTSIGAHKKAPQSK